jgi:hypothetical protein
VIARALDDAASLATAQFWRAPKLEGEQPAPRAAARPRSIWDTLGVGARATEIEIRRAYRLRALETHPDRGGTRRAR